MTNVREYFEEALGVAPESLDSPEFGTPDVDEWRAIPLDSDNGRECVKLIAGAHALLAHIRDCDFSETLVPALIRTTVIAVDNQIWNGSPD